MDRPVLKLVSDEDAISFEIRDGESKLVGRQAEVSIPHRTLSRQHAHFRYEDGVCSVSDAGSASGTWINNLNTHGPVPIRAGDVIRLGQVVFRVEIVRDDSSEVVRAHEALLTLTRRIQENAAAYREMMSTGEWSEAYAEAKGAGRWSSNAHYAIAGLKPADFSSIESLLGEAQGVIRHTPFDSDYPDPVGTVNQMLDAIEQVRKQFAKS